MCGIQNTPQNNPSPEWDGFVAKLIMVGVAASFGVFVTLLAVPKWRESTKVPIEGSLVETIIQSITLVVALATVAIQAVQTRKSNEIQERTLNGQNAQLVMNLFVQMRKHVVQLRESWIDCSEYADSPDDLPKYRLELSSVKQALKDDLLAAELLFKNTSAEFHRAINLIIEFTKKHPRPTLPGIRKSEIVDEFSNEAADIDMLISALWERQAGVAVIDSLPQSSETAAVVGTERPR